MGDEVFEQQRTGVQIKNPQPTLGGWQGEVHHCQTTGRRGAVRNGTLHGGNRFFQDLSVKLRGDFIQLSNERVGRDEWCVGCVTIACTKANAEGGQCASTAPETEHEIPQAPKCGAKQYCKTGTGDQKTKRITPLR